jgi:integrase
MKGSVKENKNGKWDICFDIGKNPETNKRRQVKRRGFKTKKEATEALVKLKAEYLNGDHLDLSSITYGEFMKQFLADRKSYLARSTFLRENDYFLHIIKPYLGNLKVQEITTLHLQKHISKLNEETHYAETTIHTAYKLIRSSFKRAKVLKLIKEDPSSDIILPRIPKKEMNIWTLDQINYFLSETKKSKYSSRYNVLYYIAIFTGMRISEITGLRWKDVILDEQLIYVRQTLVCGEIKHGAKNSSSARTISIPSVLVDELKRHRQLIELEKVKFSYRYDETDLVLPTRHGKPIVPACIRKAFHLTTEKLGLPRIRIHDLRHTHATLLIAQNVNVKLISERLGHSKIGTTLNIYSHVLPEMQRSVAEKLDEVFTKCDQTCDQ